MAWCKTVVTPMLMDLSYCSLGLSHWYNIFTIFCQRIHNFLFVLVFVQDSVAASAAELRLPATDVHVWYVTRAHLRHVGKHVSGRVQLPTGTRSTVHEFTPTSPRPISSSAWFKSGIPRQDLSWWVGKLGDWTVFRAEPNEQQFTDDILKYIFYDENFQNFKQDFILKCSLGHNWQ